MTRVLDLEPMVPWRKKRTESHKLSPDPHRCIVAYVHTHTQYIRKRFPADSLLPCLHSLPCSHDAIISALERQWQHDWSLRLAWSTSWGRNQLRIQSKNSSQQRYKQIKCISETKIGNQKGIYQPPPSPRTFVLNYGCLWTHTQFSAQVL